MTWKERYRRDPDLAESIIETLRQDLKEAEKRAEVLAFALERIRDNEWVQLGGPPKWLSKIAEEALK
jgi:predicted RNase H-like nuclease (RuvC/YqgF family)